jgi:N-acetyl-anhydromuramyl-L-alanine amidase AmpD
MLEIQKQFINYNKSVRGTNPIYIVIHDTGDPGATAQNEHDYFSGGDRGASADYFVDSDNIIQIIDTDNNYSWHCGDGHGAYGITNSNSLGIEMCIDSTGNPTDATVTNTIDLVKYLMNKYGISIDNVVRHYDASHKSCPGSFMYNSWEKWTNFKTRVSNASTGTWKLGWNENSIGWWYSPDNINKYYYKDQWKFIDSEWYSFDNQGYARESTWLKDKLWYYLKDSCAMAKNQWLWIDGECYCFNESGAMYANCTTPDGYRVDESGAWIK